MSFPARRSRLYNQLAATPISVTAAVTGTATAAINETDVVAGGKTIIITLTGDIWVASGGTFDGIRQNIIDGIVGTDSDQLQNGLAVTDVVRTSDTVVTITFSAIPSFDISAQAVYTVTVPASALTGGVAVVATPTFTVTQTGQATHNTRSHPLGIRAGFPRRMLLAS